jgi:hypothetical protein
MTTVGKLLKIGDGKCWEHNGKFMGKLIKVQHEGRMHDPDPVYYFDHGKVNGNISTAHDAKFTEVNCDGKPMNKKNNKKNNTKKQNAKKNNSNTPRVGDGKCWSIKDKYLGKFVKLHAVGRFYDPTAEYVFEHGSVDPDDYRYSGHKFKAVACRTNKKENNTRKNRK